MSREVALTTIDNPFDPFDQFEQWYNWDLSKGYNTCSYLDKVSFTSDALPESENRIEIERAMDEIIEFNPLKIYKKVVREV